MRNFTLLIIATLFTSIASAQVYNYEDGELPPPDRDSIRGFHFGFNIGFYFANSATAEIYDGHGFDRDGNRIQEVQQTWLYNSIFSDVLAGGRNIDPRIEQILEPDYATGAFGQDDMPLNMRFTSSFLYGAHIGYNFSGDFSLFLELNGTNPSTVGEFTIPIQQSGIGDPSPENFRRFQIRGEEQRLIFNLGAKKVLGKNEFFRPYVEAGANSTFVKFESNVIHLENRNNTFSIDKDITRYQTNVSGNIDEARNLTGVGFGGFAGLGGQLTMNSSFTLELGYIASLEQIKLGYLNTRNFQHIIILRVIYMNTK